MWKWGKQKLMGQFEPTFETSSTISVYSFVVVLALVIPSQLVVNGAQMFHGENSSGQPGMHHEIFAEQRAKFPKSRC